MSQCFASVDTSDANGIHIYSNVFYLSEQRGNCSFNFLTQIEMLNYSNRFLFAIIDSILINYIFMKYSSHLKFLILANESLSP